MFFSTLLASTGWWTIILLVFESRPRFVFFLVCICFVFFFRAMESMSRLTLTMNEPVTFRPSVARAGAGSLGATDGYSLPSSSSTPPPAFDDVPRSPGSVSAGRGSAAAAAPSSARSSSHASLRSRHGPAAGVLWNSHTESVRYVENLSSCGAWMLTGTVLGACSLSEVQLEASGVASAAAAAMGSVGSKVSSLSGGSLSVRLTSTAPTPTWTEGTPSFTESSSSDLDRDLGIRTLHHRRFALSPLSRRRLSVYVRLFGFLLAAFVSVLATPNKGIWPVKDQVSRQRNDAMQCA